MRRLTFAFVLLTGCSHYIDKSYIGDSNQSEKTGDAADKSVAFFEIQDVSLLPEEKAQISIKLYDNDSFLPYLNPIYDEKIEIFQDKKLIFKFNNTSSDKDKKITFIPERKNTVNVYRTNLNESTKYIALGEFIVNVMDECFPALVVDIDHTIADVSSWEVLSKRYTDIPAYEKAVEVLERLNKQYRIIYLTARNGILMQPTRDWLNFLNFPKGPIYFWDSKNYSFFSEDYKKEVLSLLKQKFHNLVAGIGDRKSDIVAYQASGLRAYAFRNDDANLPNARHVETWEEFYKDITENIKNPRELCQKKK